MRIGVPTGIASAMFAVGWATSETCSRSATLAGAHRDTSASSSGVWSQPVEPKTTGRGSVVSVGVCASAIGAHSDNGEKHKTARTARDAILLPFERVRAGTRRDVEYEPKT